jgi:dTDP-4-amino-4,6-dideoxygalactose transaminase
VIRHPNRDVIAARLADQGIQTVIHYPVPPHQQKGYPELHKLNLPLTETIHQEVLSLPISPAMDEDSTRRVIETINKLLV